VVRFSVCSNRERFSLLTFRDAPFRKNRRVSIARALENVSSRR
jgi:hypothetical protein